MLRSSLLWPNLVSRVLGLQPPWPQRCELFSFNGRIPYRGKKAGKSDQILGVVTKFFPNQNFPRFFFTPDQTFPRLFCPQLKHLPDFFVPDQYFYPTLLTPTEFFKRRNLTLYTTGTVIVWLLMMNLVMIWMMMRLVLQ